MDSVRITTKCPVHIRTGPGISYSVLRDAEKGESFLSSEFKKDAANIGWYRVNKGWICSKYVTLAQDINAKVDNTTKKSGPSSATDFMPGVTQKIVQTGVSTIGKSILGSVLGTDEHGNLTQPEDSMNDLFLARRAYGFPYQFRDTIDMRGEGKDNILGISFREAMSQFPMISYLPGRPSFLPDLPEDQKASYLEAFSDRILKPMDSAAGAFLNSEHVDMKFFTFEMDYSSYIRYVNTLCWIFAIYLGVADESVPGEGSSSFIGDVIRTIDSSYSQSKFRDYHWGNYRLANYYAGRDAYKDGSPMTKVDEINLAKIFTGDESGETPPGDEQAKDVWEIIMEAKDLDEYYTDFYISPNISYSETWNNGTKESMLAGMVKGASEFSKEIAFLLSAGAAENLGDSQQALSESLRELTGSLTGGTGLINRLMSGVTTIISGANLIFPKIWTESTYSRSFSIEIDLKTPYGNPESIFTDIMVPMAHWICLAAPRQASINTYGSPYLIKFNIPGFCAVDMGIVNSLTITKGGDGSAWSTDGLPLEVHLSINIEDLHSAMSMSRVNFVSFRDAYNFMWNDSYLDFIAASSGVNMRQNSAKRRLELALQLMENGAGDLGSRFNEEIKEGVANILNNLSIGKIFGGRSII